MLHKNEQKYDPIPKKCYMNNQTYGYSHLLKRSNFHNMLNHRMTPKLKVMDKGEFSMISSNKIQLNS